MMPGSSTSTSTPAAARNAAPPLAVSVAEKVAYVLDAHRVDPILGLLLPGVGDVACGLVGLGVVAVAASQRVPKVTLARMVLNLALSVGIGVIPLVGDAFDFWFRANSRNARLLARAGGPRPETWRDAVALIVAGLVLLAALVGVAALTVYLVHWAWIAATQGAVQPR